VYRSQKRSGKHICEDVESDERFFDGGLERIGMLFVSS
jgi:hypothetical protein